MICKQCNKEFTPSHHLQKYCSKECIKEGKKLYAKSTISKQSKKNWREKNKDYIRIEHLKYQQSNRQLTRDRNNKSYEKSRNVNISWWLMGHSLPYWKAKLRGSKLRGSKYNNLTPEYLEDLNIKQSGLCYYTGIPLRPFERGGKLKHGKGAKQPLSKLLQQVSIDKLVPNKGYVKGNVVLSSTFINIMKSQCTLNEFKTLILMISKHLNFNEKNHTPDEDLTRVIRKIGKDYEKRTIKAVKKIKKLQAKNLVKLVKRFPGELVIEKGKLVRTN